MSNHFKAKVFVNHKHVGWLRDSTPPSVVLCMRSATRFDYSLPSVFGSAMAGLELPEPEKGAVPPVTFQFVKM